ncbi:MAG: YceI family protein [Bacteriovoracaceae bacterium]
MQKFWSLLSGILLLSSFSSYAAWELDKAHSSITFGIDHLVITETKGQFDNFQVELTATKDDFSDAKGKATVEVKSINTFDTKRDNHLKGTDFFDIDKYPNIIVEVKKLEKKKDNKYKVTTAVTMHGVTKDVVFDGVYKGTVKDPWGGTRAGLALNGKLDRYDFDLKYNSVLETGGFAIGKEVRINAVLEMVKK